MEERTTVRKLNLSLFIACLAGAVIGYILAEVLYNGAALEWAPVLRTGLYFALIAFFVCLLALLSEIVTHHLRDGAWTGGNIGAGFLILLVSTLAFFLAGMLFQFLYGLGFQVKTAADVQDYIVLIDNSGSTSDTDPNEDRFSSVVSLASSLDNTHNISVSVFDETVIGTFPSTAAGADTANALQSFFDQYDSEGNTNLHTVLMETVNGYTATGRNTAVLLLSDGVSNIDLDEIADAYTAKDLPVFCVSFADTGYDGSQLLSQIAARTDGYYYEIEELSGLTQTVEKMIRLANRRQLLESRRGSDMYNTVATVLRIIFITILGCLLGVAVALTVDDTTVLKTGMILHAIGSVLAGLLTEFSWSLLSGGLIRLLMCLLISLILVPYTKTIIRFVADDTPAAPRRQVRRPVRVGTGDANDLNRRKRPGDPKSLT